SLQRCSRPLCSSQTTNDPDPTRPAYHTKPHSPKRAEPAQRFVVQGPARTRHPTNRWPVT
ncbi:hypothetical protein, partial [Cellulosimicrobium sp. TH-20]|uniref:hypothetical protein n=1 Tax=Cellulosimicrobium sp. TH-20 TaxID=1980001 RepID=UPI001C92D24B